MLIGEVVKEQIAKVWDQQVNAFVDTDSKNIFLIILNLEKFFVGQTKMVKSASANYLIIFQFLDLKI